MSNPIQQAIETLELCVKEMDCIHSATGFSSAKAEVAADKALAALQSLQGVELPPLPEPYTELYKDLTPVLYEAWSQQMQAYARTAVAAAMERGAVPKEPINMVLYCPNCGKQHIDAPEPHIEGTVDLTTWHNPPHRSHLCHECGCIWRPADVPTNGVAHIETKGKADTWIGKAPFAAPAEATQPTQAEAPSEREAFEAWAVRRTFNVTRHDGAPHYAQHRTQLLWQAWSGRAALATQQAGQGEAAANRTLTALRLSRAVLRGLTYKDDKVTAALEAIYKALGGAA